LYEKNIDQSKDILSSDFRTQRTQISQGFTSSLESTPPPSPPSSNSHHKKRSRKSLPKNGDNGGRGDSGTKRASSTFPSAAEEEENACKPKGKTPRSWWRRGLRRAMDTYCRRSLRIVLCLGAGVVMLDSCWRVYWLFGSADGVYTPALGAVESDGPEQASYCAHGYFLTYFV